MLWCYSSIGGAHINLQHTDKHFQYFGWESSITLFILVAVLCGTDNILWNIRHI